MKPLGTRHRGRRSSPEESGGRTLFGDAPPSARKRKTRTKKPAPTDQQIIEELSFLPGKSDMVAVVLRDGPTLRVPDAVASAAGLRTGLLWSRELRTRVARLTQIEKAKTHAKKYLAARLRSAEEVRRKLESKGFDAPTADTAIEQLTRAGLIDDSRLVRDIAHTELISTKTAKQALKDRLTRRGFEEEEVDRAIREGTDVSELDRARELVRDAKRKFLPSISRDAAWRRLMTRLAAAGFDEEMSRDVVEEAIGGLAE